MMMVALKRERERETDSQGGKGRDGMGAVGISKEIIRNETDD
jgi:hypothetical protein